MPNRKTPSHRVGVIVGSLRQASLNRKLATVLTGMAPDGLALDRIEIRDLPLYDEDAEASEPPAWVRFRNEARAVDAFLFVTPEYNRSVPGALKNAIDVGSRPYGKSVWAGKPAAVISLSQGALGGFGANHHLRQSMVFLDMPVLQQPEMYLGNAGKMFDDDGALVSDDVRALLGKFLEAFAGWIERNVKAAPAS